MTFAHLTYHVKIFYRDYPLMIYQNISVERIVDNKESIITRNIINSDEKFGH